MADITAEQVKELRERTAGGLMECKKALVQTGGDIEAAIKLMRETGQIKAEKKAGNVAAEGAILAEISADGKEAVLLEINCQTDFVARNKDFVEFAQQVAGLALKHRVTEIEELAEQVLSNGATVESERKELIFKLGENIQLRRLAFIKSEGLVGAYIHGGRIGVLVSLLSGDTELAKDIAMHIAASKPQVVNADDVSADIIAQEREIYFAQAQSSGKPTEIIDKMVEGRIKKFVSDISLVGQPFIKNPEITVGKLLQEKKTQVKSFVRLEVGEGIEKKVDNFAEEVMAQVRGNA